MRRRRNKAPAHNFPSDTGKFGLYFLFQAGKTTIQIHNNNRHRYCIQVDEEALNSIPLGNPHIRDGWVKLIWVGLPPLPSDPPGTADPVGEMPWMRVRARCVMVDMYQLLRDWSDWYREYRSPPEVAHS